MTDTHPQGTLAPGYRLLWYRIESVLGRGAFGTTYLAEDINLHRQVAIKEFFPGQCCSRHADSAEVRPISEEAAEDFRWAMERFLSEARTLARFEHPNIIRVLNVFEENGTAYMVMQYEHGVSLAALLKKRRTLNERELGHIALPILDGLEKIHGQGFIHRDIKPSNIYIRAGGSPVLLDFGSARQSMQAATQTLTSLVSPGYAPIEQYTSKGERQGPWTDIYGMGATLYRAVTGIVPPAAVERSEALSAGRPDYYTPAREIVQSEYSEACLDAIDHALAYNIEERPRSITEWRAELPFTVAGMETPPASGGSDATAAAEPPDGDTVALDDSGATATAVETAPTEPADPPTAATTPAGADHVAVPAETAAGPRPGYRQIAAAAVLLLTAGIIAAAIGWRGGDGSTPVGQGDRPAAAAEAGAEGTAAGDASERVQSLLAEARRDFEAMRLTTPADNNAHDKLRRVLELDPDNSRARQAVDAIYRRYLQLARAAAGEGDYDRAAEMLERAGTVKPDAPGLMQARVKLEQRRTRARMDSLSEIMEKGGVGKPAPSSRDNAGTDITENEAVRRLMGNGDR